ncbi:MurR/RpiR family transcriptional regulator [Agreia sp. COWG]|uniref:MurR/RpiR family transcriptional regulator n=1 Tax=Agreia sp. COWG TaxID=2773266 RepID=UPI001925509B|nr:MurR/RpiR family transcriptional regulator [Agreia sp. COWG]CAD6003368.1 Transcriptional regulator, RpiR family [Agreia sp. COWG]
MTFSGSDDVNPTTRIATVINSLLPSERRVVELILADLEGIVETTAQDLADRAGVARSTVIRTCQSLGYRGYPQLRVALTRELASGDGRERERDYGSGALGSIRADIDALAASLPQIASVLTDESVEKALELIVGASRLLAIANGLSSPLALDLSMRLTAVGRPTEFVADPIGQQIAARGLTSADTCIVISGSGANESSLRSARAVRAAGARLVVVTSFARSPLVTLADAALVVAPASGSFRHELEHTSRIPHVVLLESLVEVVASRLGEVARHSRSSVLSILSDNLSD